MALKHQKGKFGTLMKNVPDPIRRVVVESDNYVDALQVAAETYPNLRMIDIHTKNVRKVVVARPWKNTNTKPATTKYTFLFQ